MSAASPGKAPGFEEDDIRGELQLLVCWANLGKSQNRV